MKKRSDVDEVIAFLQPELFDGFTAAADDRGIGRRKPVGFIYIDVQFRVGPDRNISGFFSTHCSSVNGYAVNLPVNPGIKEGD